MTAEQERMACDLLKEALQWVGMVDLTVQEGQQAEKVQERIERLLVDLGEMDQSGFSSPEMLTKARRYLLIQSELDAVARAWKQLVRCLQECPMDQSMPSLIEHIRIARDLYGHLSEEKSRALSDLTREMEARGGHRCSV